MTENSVFFPLSENQKNILAVERSCPGTSVNVIGTTLRIRGRFDAELLRQSLDAVLRADASLRTRIAENSGEYVQYCAGFEAESFPLYDFSLAGREGVRKWETAATLEPMPFENCPLYRFCLYRLDEREGGLLIKFHHLISDAWSAALFCRRLGEAYLALLSGRELKEEEFSGYEDYVRYQEEYLASKKCVRDERWWENELQRGCEPSALKTVKGAEICGAGSRKSFALSRSLSDKIDSFCRERRLSPFSLYYLALAVYLRRIGGSERFTVGVPVFNRDSLEFKETTGMFVSTLPFFNEINADWSFDECCANLTGAWLELLRHQRFPYSRIQEAAAAKGGADRLFHICLSYQNGELFQSPDPSVSFRADWHYSGCQLEQLCVHITNPVKEQGYLIHYDYLTQLFTESEIENLHSCLMHLLRRGMEYPSLPVSRLSLLDDAGREKLLYDFNSTSVVLSDNDVYDRFQKTVREYPNRVALIHNGERLSYQKLEELAAAFQARIPQGEGSRLVAVMLPRCPMVMAAMMGALRGGCAFLLLPQGLPELRIREILLGGKAAVLFTDQKGIDACGGVLEDIPVIDAASVSAPSVFPEAVSVRPGDTAYVVYTSGSTGEPKGVEVSRLSLLNLASAMESVYGKGSVLSLCSLGFDAFLLESAVALLNGKTIVLPGEGETESPARIGELIRGYGVGFFATTPSRVSAMLKNSVFSAALDSVESIVCGGEHFPPALLQELSRVTRARIYNQYGPSEATVAVSMKLLNGAERVTAGKPMENCRLYVLDEWKNPLPAGVPGKLFIGGICVAKGYRGRADLTEERFCENPFVCGERMYDSGDIACWTPEGEIVLCGRADNQVKIRGLRVELQEISSCLLKHPAVKQCAVAVKQTGGADVIAAYYTSENEIPGAELRLHAAAYLPRYMVPAVTVRLEEIPLTANGKVNEALLPVPADGGGDGAPATKAEREVLDIFCSVLGKEELDAGSDYFLCGGDSLNAMETVSRVAERFGRVLKISDLYLFPTARRLAEMLENGGDALKAPVLTPAPAMERYPLTPVQQGIYMQSALDGTGRNYQMPGAFVLGGKPDVPRLAKAFSGLVSGEALLRTAFVQTEEGVFAVPQEDAELTLEVKESADTEKELESLLAPFDLAKAPLMRAKLLEKDGVWTLYLNLHHIIGDGLTTPVLMRRLEALYSGGEAEAPSLSYLDYACYRAGAEINPDDAAYWQRTLAGVPAPADFPADFNNAAEFDYRGANTSYKINKALSAECARFCKENGFTVYGLVLGAFALLFSRLTGGEDTVIGAPAAGRTLPGTAEMCGPFINTLPVRVKPKADMEVKAYLRSVRAAVSGMLDHQYMGLEEICALLKLPRSASKNPLYSVMLTQRPLDTESFTLGGEAVVFRPVSCGTAKMDLVLELAEEKDGLSLSAEYASSLYEEETLQFWCRCIEQLLHEMITSSSAVLGELEALSPVDKERFARAAVPEPVEYDQRPIHYMIEEKCVAAPGGPAVIFHGECFSRGDLDRIACRVANLLTAAGAVPGGKIGLAVDRGPLMPGAMLGILKCGCAYVPLMSSLPEERLRYMAEAAGISHVLVSGDSLKKFPAGLPCVYVDAGGEAEESFQTVPVDGDALCHVLFTSGSTGRPKGVMIAHRPVSNLFMNLDGLAVKKTGTVLCSTNMGFDTFIAESLMALAAGKAVVFCDEEEMMLPWKTAELILRYDVEYVQYTPSRMQMMLSNDRFCEAAGRLSMIILAGEVLTPRLADMIHAVTDARIINLYGPTEATVYATGDELVPGKYFNIGRPLKNGRVYLLNEEQKPVLPTAEGELWLGGDILAKGYIGNPELTAKMFVPDPFRPGGMMYRTGDMVRMRAGGTIDFLGRRDAQIKFNGQRVELEEISGAAIQTELAVLASVIPVRLDDGSMRLTLFWQPAPGKENSQEELKTCLKKTLPPYMVPSRFVAMERLPATPSGKIDIKTLKEMAETRENAGEESSSQESLDLKEKLVSIWAKVLGTEDIDTEKSFFEQGGTSLAALSVLSRCHNENIVLSIQQFYNNPTVSAQCALLAETEPAAKSAKAEPAAKSAKAEPAAEYAEESLLSSAVLGGGGFGTVLLTGATGFMGAHLLAELLKNGASQVICLVRGDTSRLKTVLCRYFGGAWYACWESSIQAVRGDIVLDSFGLTKKEYASLAERVDLVCHCAADVRHYAADEAALLEVNAGGTERAVRFAFDAGAVLYHMSTTGLADNGSGAVFTENSFVNKEDSYANLYVRSKFLGEQTVRKAVRKGLRAKIFRLGRLVGRASDGVFQQNPQSNAFLMALKGFAAAGCFPADMAEFPVDLTPVDWAAAAVLALKDAEESVFHICSPAPYSLKEAVDAAVPGLKTVPRGEFEAALKKASAGEDGAAVMPLLNLLSGSAAGALAEVSNERTLAALKEAGFVFLLPKAEVLLRAFR